jgi:hypothetical protein
LKIFGKGRGENFGRKKEPQTAYFDIDFTAESAEFFLDAVFLSCRFCQATEKLKQKVKSKKKDNLLIYFNCHPAGQ